MPVGLRRRPVLSPLKLASPRLNSGGIGAAATPLRQPPRRRGQPASATPSSSATDVATRMGTPGTCVCVSPAISPIDSPGEAGFSAKLAQASPAAYHAVRRTLQVGGGSEASHDRPSSDASTCDCGVSSTPGGGGGSGGGGEEAAGAPECSACATSEKILALAASHAQASRKAAAAVERQLTASNEGMVARERQLIGSNVVLRQQLDRVLAYLDSVRPQLEGMQPPRAGPGDAAEHASDTDDEDDEADYASAAEDDDDDEEDGAAVQRAWMRWQAPESDGSDSEEQQISQEKTPPQGLQNEAEVARDAQADEGERRADLPPCPHDGGGWLLYMLDGQIVGPVRTVQLQEVAGKL